MKLPSLLPSIAGVSFIIRSSFSVLSSTFRTLRLLAPRLMNLGYIIVTGNPVPDTRLSTFFLCSSSGFLSVQLILLTVSPLPGEDLPLQFVHRHILANVDYFFRSSTSTHLPPLHLSADYTTNGLLAIPGSI